MASVVFRSNETGSGSLVRSGWQAHLEPASRSTQEMKKIRDLKAIQGRAVHKAKQKQHEPPADNKVFHPESVYAGRGELRWTEDIPPEVAAYGFFQHSARAHKLDIVASFTLASPTPQDPNQAGMGVNIYLPDDKIQSLTATNTPNLFTDDPVTFLDINAILAVRGKHLGALEIVAKHGLSGLRAILQLLRETHEIRSLAAETYWSRHAYAASKAEGSEGVDEFAYRYQLVPSPATTQSGGEAGSLRERLRKDLKKRLAAGVSFHLEILPYVDERRTPIDRPSKAWEVGPIRVAEIVFASRDIDAPEERSFQERARNEFFLHNAAHRPLGVTGAMRDIAYAESLRLNQRAERRDHPLELDQR